MDVVQAARGERDPALADGALAVVNNQVDTTSGTIRLKAVFVNKNHALWPGQSVSTRLLVRTLKDAGYSVEAFANGRDAIEWLHEATTPPKLLLIDLMMPVMDGWQFLEEQQKSPREAAIPVVVLSASGSFGGTKKDIPFLRKPVAPKPLLAVVARYCEPRHVAAPTAQDAPKEG